MNRRRIVSIILSFRGETRSIILIMCDALQINWKLPSSNANTILGPHKKENTKSLREFYRRSSDPNNNNSNSPSNALKRQNFSKKNDDSNGKYTLRACSIQKRIETESRKGQPRKRGPKPRPKPLPMSKYRRKTANQRERQRMGEINVAFDKLRDKIPSPSSGKGRCEKMTKINILHVTINYIRALESILDTGEPGVQVYGTSLIRGPTKSDPSKTPSSPLMSHRTPSPVGEASEDSGIMEEEEEQMYSAYPEWTELTSTLDFPGLHGKIVHKDISLTSLSGRPEPPRTLANKTALSLAEFLSSSDDVVSSPSPLTDRQLNGTSNTSPGGKSPESSLFTDLNSSFESISEGLVDFSHEDPFENLFF